MAGEGKRSGSLLGGNRAINWKEDAPATFFLPNGKEQVSRGQIETNPTNPNYTHILRTFSTGSESLVAPVKIVGNTTDGTGIVGVSNGLIQLAAKKKSDLSEAKKETKKQ